MRNRIAAVLTAGLLLGLLLPGAPAVAHSFVRETKPAEDATLKRTPKRVAIRFNEPVEAEFATITVQRRKQRVRAAPPFHVRGADDALAVRLRTPLRNGRYVVTWRVVSADSHIQTGQFTFRVKQPAAKEKVGDDGADDDAAPADAGPGAEGSAGDDGAMAAGESPPQAAMTAGAEEVAGHRATQLVAAARGFTMAGLLLLVGLVTFWVLAWRGLRGALAPPRRVHELFVRRWRRMAAAGLVTTAVATVAGVYLQGAAAANVPLAAAARLEVVEGVLATGFGKAAVGRLVLLELLAVTAVLWRLLPLSTSLRPSRAVGAAALQPGTGNARLVLLTALVLPLLLTMSLVSHATSAEPVALHIAADAVHLAAAGAWIGGLVVLLAGAFPATRGLDPGDRVRVLGPTVVRFSRIAAVSVAVVIATGTLRAVDTVGSLPALTQSAYGRAMLVKLAVFTVMMAFGASNHFWTVRRIRAAGEGSSAIAALATLRRSVAAETVLATVIVVTTAVLVSLPMATM